MPPRHDGKPAPGEDFDQFLHHALHAAADQLEPHPDGLDRIRARVRPAAAHASTVSAVNTKISGSTRTVIVIAGPFQPSGAPPHPLCPIPQPRVTA